VTRPRVKLLERRDYRRKASLVLMNKASNETVICWF